MVSLHPVSATAKGMHKAAFVQTKSKAIKQLCQQAEELVQSSDTNLIAKELQLNNLQAKLLEFDEELVVEIQKKLIAVYAELSDKAFELKGQKKWLQLGFSEAMLSTHAACVSFLLRSGVAFSIATFKEATAKGIGIHDVLVENGEPMIRVQGEYMPWSVLRQKFELDARSGKIISKTNPAELYTYSSPQGLVKSKSTPYPLYPIEQLSPQELKSLQEHAKVFQDDPLKNCVLQVVTTSDYAFSPSWLVEGINEAHPKHTSIRLVDNEGKVFSLGLELAKAFEEYVQADPMSCMATGYAKVGTPDYRDTRSFDEKLITNIPIDEKTLKAIIAFANSINKGEGVRFSIAKQNCNTFGVVALGLAGITVDARVTVADMVGRMAPKCSAIPVVGGALSWLKSKVTSVVAPLFSYLQAYTPPLLKKTLTFASNVVSYIPKKLGTLFVNSIFLLFGAANEAQTLLYTSPQNEASTPHGLASFATSIPSWTGLFDDENSLIFHPYKLLDWQKEQKSTIYYSPSAIPKMHLLPK